MFHLFTNEPSTTQQQNTEMARGLSKAWYTWFLSPQFYLVRLFNYLMTQHTVHNDHVLNRALFVQGLGVWCYGITCVLHDGSTMNLAKLCRNPIQIIWPTSNVRCHHLPILVHRVTSRTLGYNACDVGYHVI